MKIFFFFTLWLFSGSVSCSDVIGYPGGIVRIYCYYKDLRTVKTYFCKVKQNECVKHEKVSLIDCPGYIEVTFKNLSLEDAGLYQCGGTGVWNHTVNLKVNQDSCCLRSKTVTEYLGENITISCSYPEQFQTNLKNFYQQAGQHFTELVRTTDHQKGRFSISDDTGSKVFIVNISDLREEDGGVYYCGVWNGGESISYLSLYTEIQLHVSELSTSPKKTTPANSSSRLEPTSAAYRTTPTAATAAAYRTTPTAATAAAYRTTPTAATAAAYRTTPTAATAAAYRTTPTAATAAAAMMVTSEVHFSSSVIITVYVCLVLLLVGGLTLIFYILKHKKTQNSTLIYRRSETHNTAEKDFETNSSGHENISMDPIYQCLDPNTRQPDSVYQSLKRKTNQTPSEPKQSQVTGV